MSCVVLLVATHTAPAFAQERFPLIVRGGLGGGVGAIHAANEFEWPRAKGGGLQWDGALGVFVARWLALHSSAFGSVSPSARPSSGCNDCPSYGRETIWSQTYGLGLTATPGQGLRLSRVRPILSVSAGLAIGSAPRSPVAVGAGVQLLFGYDYEVRENMRVGVALQGMFEGKNPRDLATDGDFKAGHVGGTVIVSFDRRAAQRPRP